MAAMTTSLVGASSTNLSTWTDIEWCIVNKQVRRLQMRIAKAVRERKHGKVKALQWILTHSYYAKLLAVKRVTKNKGSKTAGVDGITWTTHAQKMQAIKQLRRRGYNPIPLRRIYIPKRNGKRALGVPSMKDRAMQALYLQALEPVVEMQVDKSAYGFRPLRSTADAIEHCFNAIANKYAATWILEGDIKSCFDKICHQWLLRNTQMDKTILGKWLSSGYLEKAVFHPTNEGTPQGGIVSPALMNITLSGLEKTVKSLASPGDKLNVISYADDFIITGASKEVLEEKVKPALMSFLAERGLELSKEKTLVTSVVDGFDFLGFNVRKYKGKLLIKPSKKGVKSFLSKVRTIMKTNKAITTVEIIQKLNPVIRGWTNYYRHVVAKETFNYIEHQIFRAIWRWAKRRHPNKSGWWVKDKYFRSEGIKNWIFFAKTKDKTGKEVILDLFNPSKVKIKRYIKIRCEAKPYDPEFREYFKQRKLNKNLYLEHTQSMARLLPIF